MSLENADTTVLDDTIKKLAKRTWALANLSINIFFSVAEKKKPSEGCLKKIKQIVEEISKICEELP